LTFHSVYDNIFIDLTIINLIEMSLVNTDHPLKLDTSIQPTIVARANKAQIQDRLADTVLVMCQDCGELHDFTMEEITKPVDPRLLDFVMRSRAVAIDPVVIEQDPAAIAVIAEAEQIINSASSN
jgi:hypothetical protein